MIPHLRQLLHELRRRRVFRVAGVYLVVGWVVIQAADVLVPQLLLPEWVARAIILAVILGFPIACVLAWAFEVTPEGVRLESADSAKPLPASGGRAARPAALLTVLLVGTSILVGAWLAFRTPGERMDPSELASRVSGLVAEGRTIEAFALAARSEAAGTQVPDSIWPRVSIRLTLSTEPEGARVLALPFDTLAEGSVEPRDWNSLGATPLRGIRIPKTDHILRIEHDGYATAELLASSRFELAEIIGDRWPEILMRVSLAPAGDVPEDMVLVPGGAYELSSPELPPGRVAALGDFFLDRFEVSNARFAEFVDAGGYDDAAHWRGLEEDVAGVRERERIRGTFRDRTNLPAPRGWVGQRPPAGKERHPVAGVSWYEAAAYCSFRDARLPTLFEWEKGGRDGRVARRESTVMPWGFIGPEGVRRRANFGGNGTVPVDAHPFGMSHYGVYGLAGNVKEWTLNRVGSGRAVTGGSWQDPLYLHSEAGSHRPTESSDALGFRCARSSSSAARIADQGAGPLDLDWPTPVYDAVDEATFRTLLSHYRYDPRPLAPQVIERVDGPGWTREKIGFDGPGGDRVLAYFYVPSSAEPPFQTLLFVPGAAVFFGVRVSDDAEWLLGPVIRSGRAVLAVVLEGMTERERPPGTRPPEPSSVAFRDLMVLHATELSLGLDYLATRTDVDTAALAYVGLSFGAGSRLPFAAIDGRYKAVVLVGGGIDERMHPTLPEASNINFAPYIRPPKLLINGLHDEEHPWLTRGLPLWNLLREPKDSVLVEGVGHVAPPEVLVPAMVGWLDRTLGPVRR